MFSFFKSEGNTGDKGNMRLWIVLAISAIGVLLILVGGNAPKKTEEATATQYTPERDEVIIYQTYLEERIETLCQSVQGVGNVTAIVTLSGSFESVYATEYKDGEESYVVIGSGSSAAPLFLSRSAPEIAGIGIVCHGGNAATVRQELTSLLCATFRIPSNRIYVTQAH